MRRLVKICGLMQKVHECRHRPSPLTPSLEARGGRAIRRGLRLGGAREVLFVCSVLCRDKIDKGGEIMVKSN